MNNNGAVSNFKFNLLLSRSDYCCCTPGNINCVLESKLRTTTGGLSAATSGLPTTEYPFATSSPQTLASHHLYPKKA